jgi:predicted dehydrogenase
MELKVGLIGYGAWGKNLARIFAQEGVLSGICDI